MNFIRIDDVSDITIDIILKLIKLSQKNLIFINLIIGNISIENISKLKKFRNIVLVVHGFNHNKIEFLQDFTNQELVFKKIDTFLIKNNLNIHFFSPPYNLLNKKTIRLLYKYNYNNLLLDYKNIKKYNLEKEKIKIYESNYFFNKKKFSGGWYIDEVKDMLADLKNLKNKKFNIGVEIHPQYINNKNDISKYIFLINYINNYDI